jgi:transcriptional regulator with XRE-family HTH domain
MILRSENVGKAIQSKRKEKNISQDKLGVELNLLKMGGQQISNIERGRAQLPLKHIHRISSVLEIPLDEFIDLLVMDYRNAVTRELKKEVSNVEAINQLSRTTSVGDWRGSLSPDWP